MVVINFEQSRKHQAAQLCELLEYLNKLCVIAKRAASEIKCFQAHRKTLKHIVETGYVMCSGYQQALLQRGECLKRGHDACEGYEVLHCNV